jgi:hypothetical protein
MAGRPPGSKNKDKPFRDALRMAIAASEDNPRTLRRLAETLYDRALEGDVQAIKEIGDRLDGKVAQSIVGEDEDGNTGPLVISWLKS